MIRMIIRIRRLQTYERKKLTQTHNIRNKYPKVHIQYFVISLKKMNEKLLVCIWSIYRRDYKERNTMICFGTLIKRRD